MGRKIEWAKSLDEVMTLNFVLRVEDRDTTIRFSNAALQDEIQRVGERRAKEGVLEDVKRVVANPKKQLTGEEQVEIVRQLAVLLTSVK